MDKYFYVELINEIKGFKNKYGDKHALMKYEEYVLKLNEPNLSYNFVKLVEGADVKRHEDIIMESKSPRICFLFAKDIEGADTDALYEVVKNSGDEYYIRIFKTDAIDKKEIEKLNSKNVTRKLVRK